MGRAEISNKIIEVLTNDFKIPKEKIVGAATFRGDLSLDSLDAVDFVYLVCRDLGFEPNIHDFVSVHTVDQLIDALEKKLAS